MIKKIQSIQPHSFFVVIAMVFGLLYVFLTPIFQGPDEPLHFLTISRYGNGILTPTVDDKGIATVAHPGIIELYEKYPIEIGKTSKDGYFENIPMLISIDLGNFREGYKYIPTSIYSPISYIQLIPVYFLGALLNINPFILFILLRVMGLAAWATIIYYSIKIIPRAKWMVTILALLPMSLFIGAMVGADSLVNALVFLIIALITKAIVQPVLFSKKYMIALLSLVVLLGLTKQTFFVVSLLLLALPRPKYIKKTFWLLLILAIFIFTASFAMGWQILNNSYTYSPIEGVSQSEQLKLIFDRPQWFIRTLWNTYFTTHSSQLYIGFIGVLGWLNISLPIWIIGGWLALFVSCINTGLEKTRIYLNKFQKLIFISVALILLGLVTTALYLVWSPVGAGIVSGLQGRYFLPIFTILLPLFILNRSEPTGSKKIIIISGIFVLHIATFLVYISHYVQVL